MCLRVNTPSEGTTFKITVQQLQLIQRIPMDLIFMFLTFRDKWLLVEKSSYFSRKVVTFRLFEKSSYFSTFRLFYFSGFRAPPLRINSYFSTFRFFASAPDHPKPEKYGAPPLTPTVLEALEKLSLKRSLCQHINTDRSNIKHQTSIINIHSIIFIV